ncbi:tubulin-tyrosine ligase/Tubulin polyglutamylase, partial [Kipferlia bialata]|eukprot:g786.t1
MYVLRTSVQSVSPPPNRQADGSGYLKPTSTFDRGKGKGEKDGRPRPVELAKDDPRRRLQEQRAAAREREKQQREDEKRHKLEERQRVAQAALEAEAAVEREAQRVVEEEREREREIARAQEAERQRVLDEEVERERVVQEELEAAREAERERVQEEKARRERETLARLEAIRLEQEREERERELEERRVLEAALLEAQQRERELLLEIETARERDLREESLRDGQRLGGDSVIQASEDGFPARHVQSASQSVSQSASESGTALLLVPDGDPLTSVAGVVCSSTPPPMSAGSVGYSARTVRVLSAGFGSEGRRGGLDAGDTQGGCAESSGCVSESGVVLPSDGESSDGAVVPAGSHLFGEGTGTGVTSVGRASAGPGTERHQVAGAYRPTRRHHSPKTPSLHTVGGVGDGSAPTRRRGADRSSDRREYGSSQTAIGTGSLPPIREGKGTSHIEGRALSEQSRSGKGRGSPIAIHKGVFSLPPLRPGARPPGLGTHTRGSPLMAGQDMRHSVSCSRGRGSVYREGSEPRYRGGPSRSQSVCQSARGMASVDVSKPVPLPSILACHIYRYQMSLIAPDLGSHGSLSLPPSLVLSALPEQNTLRLVGPGSRRSLLLDIQSAVASVEGLRVADTRDKGDEAGSGATDGGFHILWTWRASAVTETLLLGLHINQAVNHFPNIQILTRKDQFHRRLRALLKTGSKAERYRHMIPVTFSLPTEYSQYVRHTWNHSDRAYIVKPNGLSRGRDIRVVRDNEVLAGEHAVVQEYVSNPATVGGRKLDFRIYALLLCLPGGDFRAYLYTKGIARVCRDRFTMDESQFSNHFVHLTNTSINSSLSEEAEIDRCKLTMVDALAQLNQELGECFTADTVWAKIRTCILLSLHSVLFSSSESARIAACPNCFEVLGFDVLFDRLGNPYLIEANASPSLSFDTDVDRAVKPDLIRETLALVQASRTLLP